MVSLVRHPIWISAAPRPGAKVFATLFAIESLSRGTMASLVPIQAYNILRDSQQVSILYTVISVVGLGATLSIPLVLARFPRRFVYSAGALALVLACLVFMTDTLVGQAGGLLLRVAGSGMLAITLNLYIMDHIRKTDLVRAESIRMAGSTLAWAAGPFFGVWLYTRFGLVAAYGTSAFFALVLLALFWYFRLSDNPAIARGPSRPANPIANVRRFVAQPRLLLAWLIAFTRSSYWSTYYVYGPILMVASGKGELAGGLLVSAGNGLMMFALFWGRIGLGAGLRRTIAFAFFCMTLCLLVAGYAGKSMPILAAAMLLVGAFFCVSLDALGSTAFIRAVHAHERAQMTSVHRTYLDFSALVPSFIYSIILAYFGLGAVFVALSGLTLATAVTVWNYVPRRM